MGRMVRKQIVLDEELERELAARAKVMGVSQSELVRRAVSKLLLEEKGARASAWERARSVMLHAHTLRTGSGGRRWTREEVHERSGRPRH